MNNQLRTFPDATVILKQVFASRDKTRHYLLYFVLVGAAIVHFQLYAKIDSIFPYLLATLPIRLIVVVVNAVIILSFFLFFLRIMARRAYTFAVIAVVAYG
jgi:hypothetical protein